MSVCSWETNWEIALCGWEIAWEIKPFFRNLPADIVYVCRTYSASCQEKNRRLEDMGDFFAKQFFIITIR